jgi:hypothetical protein
MSTERAPPTEQERLQAAYQRLFNVNPTIDSALVIADLAKFCGEDADCFDETSVRQTDYNLGKRRVWLRIERMMRGTPEKQTALQAEDVEGQELAPRLEE